MLSQHPSTMDQRQRYHRRQQSAPVELEGSITMHCSPQMYTPASQFPHAMEFVEGGNAKVETHTNTGQNQQHYLQVAQQHCQARPGQQQQQPQYGSVQSAGFSEQEFRDMQHRKLDAQIDSLIRENTESFIPTPASTSNVHFVKIERTRSNPEGYYRLGGVNINPDTVLMSPQSGQHVYIDTSMNTSVKRQTASFDSTNSGWSTPLQQSWTLPPQRPVTPPNQNGSGYTPHTPIQTPHHAKEQTFLHGKSPIVTGATTPLAQPSPQKMGYSDLKPCHAKSESHATTRPAKRTLSSTGLLQGESPELLPAALPSPPQTVRLGTSRKFDVAIIPGPTLDNIPKLSFAPSHSHHTSTSSSSPYLASIPESPSLEHSNPMDGIPLAIRSVEDDDLVSSPMHDDDPVVEYGPWDLGMRPALSPRSMALTDLGLDATIEDTGVSAEEVQAYISEPDPATGKWSCMFPECGRLFSRKENIRSHIQTHLGDRQYRCAHCNKRFVRQHDLKRHAKIHSGVKPFPCGCGNSFARHDALTRHRQRGICNGKFPGVIKKEAKRGRPKKDRSNNEERFDSVSRNGMGAAGKSYASSEAGTSESSVPDSPASRMLDIIDSIPDHVGTLVSVEAPFSFPPSAFTYTPPHSPYSTGSVPSPGKQASVEPVLTPASLLLTEEHDCGNVVLARDLLLSSVLSTTPPATSHPGSPPELSHSSPQSLAHFQHLDVLNNSETGPAPIEPDFDMLVQQFTDHRDNDNGGFDAGWSDGGYGAFVKDDDLSMLSSFGRAFGRPIDDDDGALF